MRMTTLSIVSLLFMALCACGHKSDSVTTDADSLAEASESAAATTSANSSIPKGAQAIIKAYPDMGITYRDNKIWFKDGSSIVYDDGKKKDFLTKMDNADVEDMFSLTYNRGDRPGFQEDAGRCRCDAFLKKMYGNSQAEVAKNLVIINWFGQNLKVTKINGVNKQLEALQKELKTHTEWAKYFTGCGGTFNWRAVRGTKNRQSAHSYGMTMDVNTSFSNYWLWDNKNIPEDKELKAYNNRIPKEIVLLFEKYGFIWGGHWYHYDTMHFEYRPEILIYNNVPVTFVK